VAVHGGSGRQRVRQGGRLLFAGEHSQSARLAYADGAMTSGIREAKRLLGVPSVRSGPVSAAHT
jgi:monoamine oxidase